MAQVFLPLWMSGREAVAFFARAAGCEESNALALLQQACRDGVVHGREHGRDAEREFYEARGLSDRGEAEWRRRFIHRAVNWRNFRISGELRQTL